MPSGDARFTDRLADLLQLECSSRVLEVGCGDGGSAVRLAWRLGCRVVGVDPSQPNVEAAARRAREQGVDGLCSFLLGDADRIDLGDGGFDAVICESAFDGLPDPVAAAREFVRLLRPGGRVGLNDLAPPDRLAASLRSAGLQAGPTATVDGYAVVIAVAGPQAL
jgi:ubiquinone/menaquinone biosynthesis C-methylase UbiE